MSKPANASRREAIKVLSSAATLAPLLPAKYPVHAAAAAGLGAVAAASRPHGGATARRARRVPSVLAHLRGATARHESGSRASSAAPVTTSPVRPMESPPGCRGSTWRLDPSRADPALRRPDSLFQGWGLHAESLGRELGMFTDPYQWFGHLDMDAARSAPGRRYRAARTALEPPAAIHYMLANTSMAPRDVQVEIDRYISQPGQACACKTGEPKICELHERAVDVKKRHRRPPQGLARRAVLET